MRGIARIFALGLLVAAAAVAAGRWPTVQAWLETAGPAGAAAYGAGIAVLMMGCFPVSVLGFTAGALYGPWLGYALVVPAAYVGAALMFGLGRSVFRRPIRRWVESRSRLRALEEIAANSALRLNILARLSPFNIGLVCYTLAAGTTTARAYLLGLVGAVPSMAVHVLVGSLVRSTGRALGAGNGPTGLEVGATVVAIVALLALGWQVGRIARQAWRRAADDAGLAAEGDTGEGATER